MATSSVEKASATSEGSNPAPVIVDFGKHKSKAVKQLRNGKGKLIDDVYDTISDLRSAGTISATAQPVVFVVREKRAGKGLLSMLKV